jgi:hypothetical protein
MGLVHGHFDQRSTDPDIHTADSESIAEERINAGIAIVVPANSIRETLVPLIEADLPSDIRAPGAALRPHFKNPS